VTRLRDLDVEWFYRNRTDWGPLGDCVPGYLDLLEHAVAALRDADEEVRISSHANIGLGMRITRALDAEVGGK